MSFAPEPPHLHDRAERTAVLLINLGSPAAPTAAALRRYLAEFLSDPRVVEIPRPLWWLLLHGLLLRVRPAQSAAKYAAIWTPDGSPLLTWSARQAKRLQGNLGQRGHQLLVRHAMRYGAPSIGSALDALKAEGATRILVLPLYPQYAAATTASAFDAVAAWARRIRRLPELRFVNHYHDDPGYIDALADSVREHWRREGRADKLVMSFHGLPARTLALGDPYHCECQVTARLLAERLQLQAQDYIVSFQSRLGRARWLQPYTEPTLKRLAAEGVRTVDAICPGFAADNLETLEEIGIEGKAAFLGAGGKEFRLVPCLNDRDPWMRALTELSLQHLQGWPTQVPDPALLDEQARRAVAAGAPR
ncbi:ferrochelatase [Aquincola sp. S2]|uniref:Ferrochelatase n=1 Tax=Pseudaquabacterium terrae TaxID=2732868 RepID=A0ABX2EIT7_9BURK|nr:ferrochelatase [Aquabacterium terrae]NRF68552.1 ferrochelatase [Aquabacterium terrae]